MNLEICIPLWKAQWGEGGLALLANFSQILRIVLPWSAAFVGIQLALKIRHRRATVGHATWVAGLGFAAAAAQIVPSLWYLFCLSY